MNETILVTGATGNLGGHVLARLQAAGRGVRGLSRRPPAEPGAGEWSAADLSAGSAGLGEALEGVGTVVHCATDGRTRQGDVQAARNLVAAALRGGRPHIVYVSIIGVDRHPLAYYRAKHEVEQLLEASGLPYTILRAAQFHDMLHFALSRAARLPVLPVLARTSFQTVDTAHVASRTAELAVDEPRGRVADLPGPQTLTMTEMARAHLRASGTRRPLLPVLLPGRVPRAYREGLHLAPGPVPGSRTFEDFLAGAPAVRVPAAARKPRLRAEHSRPRP
ncbi:SDR family oxidoreductase [Streptomyces sp. NPDC001381]|uniref:SDR family oxidoreductase n=1 Tax=Streptomyces sp. NPDC001381 TaxID=3364567 RepID=UPI0036C79331